mgnify:FL=1
MTDINADYGAPEAGGPAWYLSNTYAETMVALAALLPELDDADTTIGDLSVDEVQSVTLTAASGGTFTLSFGGETTSAIAYNAAAAAVEAALEALTTIGANNVSVSGEAGGPYAVTFTEGLGEQDVALMTADGASLTGEGAAIAVAVTTAGVCWIPIPVMDQSNVKFIEESEDITPLNSLWRTADCVTKLGIEEITVVNPRADVKSLTRWLRNATQSDTAAGASQVGRYDLEYGAQPFQTVYRHLLGVRRNHLGYWTLICFPKVRPIQSFEIPFGGQTIKTAGKLKVFAHDGLDGDNNVMIIWEMRAAATS